MRDFTFLRYKNINEMKFLKHSIALLLAVVALNACDSVNNKSLPSYSVRIYLNDYGLWNTYGVHALGEFRIFNREKGLPSNFPYNINTYTGFGGVLLFMGQDMQTGGGVPLAFDLACPVEHDVNVTVSIDPDNLDAVCSKCKSHYDVLIGSGGPKSGMALERKVGLNPYRVVPTSTGGYIITNR